MLICHSHLLRTPAAHTHCLHSLLALAAHPPCGHLPGAYPCAQARDAPFGSVPANFVVYNCTFSGSEGHPMIYWGRQATSVRIENNLFEWIDWTAVTTMPVHPWAPYKSWDRYFTAASLLYVQGSPTAHSPSVFRRNRARHWGSSAGVGNDKPGVVKELNHLSNQ